MRKFAIAFSLIAALTATAAAKRFEARSEHYLLSVEIDGDKYRVQVADATTSTNVLEASFPASPAVPMTATSQLRDGGVVRVSLNVLGELPALSARLDVVKDGMVTDHIAVSWSTGPRPKVLQRLADSPLTTKYPDALRVGGDVKAPIVLQRVEPVYPEDARRDRVSGVVIVETVIGKDGAVKDVTVLKDIGYGLGEAAANAVRQWRFSPATHNGEPVDVIFNLTVNFKIDGGMTRSPSR